MAATAIVVTIAAHAAALHRPTALAATELVPLAAMEKVANLRLSLSLWLWRRWRGRQGCMGCSLGLGLSFGHGLALGLALGLGLPLATPFGTDAAAVSLSTDLSAADAEPAAVDALAGS